MSPSARSVTALSPHQKREAKMKVERRDHEPYDATPGESAASVGVASTSKRSPTTTPTSERTARTEQRTNPNAVSVTALSPHQKRETKKKAERRDHELLDSTSGESAASRRREHVEANADHHADERKNRAHRAAHESKRCVGHGVVAASETRDEEESRAARPRAPRLDAGRPC